MFPNARALARLMAATCVLLLAACGGPDYEHMQRATVLVEVMEKGVPVGKGAGVLTRHGVLTAGHVVDGLREGQSLRVRFYDGEYVDAAIDRLTFEQEVIEVPYSSGGKSAHALADMALLSVPTYSGYPVAEVDCEPPPLGARVYEVGHPLRMEWSTTEGQVIATRPRIGSAHGRWLAISAITSPGNSGGPVYARSGLVVGIVSHSMVLGSFYTPVGGVVVPSGHHFAASGPVLCEWLGESKPVPGGAGQP